MDETSVACGYAGLRGTIVKSKSLSKVTENISLADKRGHVTYAALISNDPVVQRVLPQFIVGRANKMNHRAVKALHAFVPTWLHLLTYPSGWVDETIMIYMLETLAQALAPVSEGRRFIFVCDGHRAHMSLRLSELAEELGITLLYIPPKLTGELQPLDTHVFKKFKENIKEGFRRWRARSAEGKLETGAWFLEVVRGVIGVQYGDWAHAFARCGLDGQLSAVSATKIARLVSDHPLPCGPQMRPTREQVGLVLNKRNVPFYDELVPQKRPRVTITL